MIEYYLDLNPLTENPDDCSARTLPIRVLTRSDILEECCAEGTGITPYEAESIFKRIEKVIAESLEKGYSINTPLINISPSISGVFENWNDSFDPNRHKLKFNATPGVLLKKVAEETKVQKTDRRTSAIDIYGFKDHTIGSGSEIITSGGIGELKGKKLKLDPADSTQGIFFIAEDGKETRVAVYVSNTDTTQIFQIPVLGAGKYKLQLRCISKNSKKLSVGSFEKVLTVE
ncbi:MAG: DUF4469 domain-containing protein [Marinifilum sp.]|jgi:hypothetical protein|nr:DUF4469 domain-containing protein [Marinifilum sp.]